jgi:hypothetical protein
LVVGRWTAVLAVLGEGMRQYKIRYDAVDAPNKGKPWGSRTR